MTGLAVHPAGCDSVVTLAGTDGAKLRAGVAMTEEQYLAIERAAEFRSEFVNGEMFAMAGASMRHVRIQQNLAGELHASLRGSRCEALGSDCRIKWLSLYLRREQSVPSGITID